MEKFSYKLQVTAKIEGGGDLMVGPLKNTFECGPLLTLMYEPNTTDNLSFPTVYHCMFTLKNSREL